VSFRDLLDALLFPETPMPPLNCLRVRTALALALVLPRLAAGQFTPKCNSPHFPTPAPSNPLDIDTSCGLVGTKGGTGKEGPQNAAKNNFCAIGPAKSIEISDMIDLQHQAEADPAVAFGKATSKHKAGPALNRKPLEALGEGKIRVITGFVKKVRQEGSESVNCGKAVTDDTLHHDIHVSLVEDPKLGECSGVVAEMVPHHRPDSWNPINVKKVMAAKKLVRLTGQLLFDSAHMPCNGGTPLKSGASLTLGDPSHLRV
jgi:hypothetical protein